jgi:hypothetical protein
MIPAPQELTTPYTHKRTKVFFLCKPFCMNYAKKNEVLKQR